MSDGSGLPSLPPPLRPSWISCSWRTCPVYSLSTAALVTKKSSRTWPRSGSMRNGVVTERPMSAPRTSARGSSSWPTPDAAVSTKINCGGSNGRQGVQRPLLAALVEKWQPGQGSHWEEVDERTPEKRSQAGWPTPSTANAEQGAGTNRGQGSLDLVSTAAQWSTPQVSRATYQRAHGETYELLPQQAEAWATPSARDWRDGRASDATMDRNSRPLNEQAVMSWPTPRASLNENRGTRDYGRTGGAALSEVAATWPTPRAIDSEAAGRGSNAQGGSTLTEATASWPTPRASEGEHGGPSGRDSSGSASLTQVATSGWPTPAAADSEQAGSQNFRATLTSSAVSFPGHRDPTTPTAGDSTSSDSPTSLLRRRLNPYFVEALMGWPIGWSLPYPLDSMVDQVLEDDQDPDTTLEPTDSDFLETE